MAPESRTEPRTRAFPPTPPAKMTYEEFLAWADEDIWAEWIDGKVIILTPASNQHQDLAGFLTALLRLFVEAHGLGVVRPAPFQMKTGADLPGREPDILFIAHDHLDRLKNTYVDGPADLVVEIISPDSRARDRGEKFYEYEQGGVGEYWLIDPLRRQAEWYRLGEDGIFRPLPVGDDGIFRSTVLAGLWLHVEWLWQDPLPLLLTVLKDWELV
jgi:Uma2 family endonuclease